MSEDSVYNNHAVNLTIYCGRGKEGQEKKQQLKILLKDIKDGGTSMADSLLKLLTNNNNKNTSSSSFFSSSQNEDKDKKEEEHELLKLLIKTFIEQGVKADIPDRFIPLIKRIAEELQQ